MNLLNIDKFFSQKICLMMLIESKTTEHTGKVKAEITKLINEQI